MNVSNGLPSRDYACPGSSWNDVLGPSRRAEARERMARRCYVGKDDAEPWVSRDVDREALEMAYTLLTFIAPVGPDDRDRGAIIAFGAMSGLLDSAGTLMKDFEGELLDREFRGKPVREWARRAARGVDEWTAGLMLHGLSAQIDQLRENRVERKIELTREQHRTNAADYRAYLRWRDQEGWYYGGLLCCAVAAGIDVRDIPQHWIDETLESAILFFDIHGALRHACEDEIGHSLNYLPGDQHAQVSSALEAATEIMMRIQDATDLDASVKEYLMRFVSGIVMACYGTPRYARTTALHVARPEDVRVSWSHVNSSPVYRYTYSRTTEGAGRD